MKITKVTKSGRWWKGLRTTWAMEDESGEWWLLSGRPISPSKALKNKKMKDIKRGKTSRSSMNLSWKEYMLIALACLLGVSLAINLFYLL